MLLNELLKTIPSDTEQRVNRARERFNQNIREALRQETGLRFRPRGRAGDLQASEFISIPVRLVAGLPMALQRREIKEDQRVAALLAPWRRTLEQLLASGQTASEKILALVDGLIEPNTERQYLQGSVRLAKFLLEQTQGFDLAAWILEVNKDVLGAYHFIFVTEPTLLPEPERQESHVELYWGVIGLFSQILGLNPEALTIVVLAHELAHAYTHRAADIDGKFWDSQGFGRTDLAVVEGLAQYYTARVCDRLMLSAPEAKGAYEELLKHQPAAYQTHTPWLKKYKPEEVRFALVVARREGVMPIDGFESVLRAARSQLRWKEAEE